MLSSCQEVDTERRGDRIWFFFSILS